VSGREHSPSRRPLPSGRDAPTELLRVRLKTSWRMEAGPIRPRLPSRLLPNCMALGGGHRGDGRGLPASLVPFSS
jgi:hypothetical protein